MFSVPAHTYPPNCISGCAKETKEKILCNPNRGWQTSGIYLPVAGLNTVKNCQLLALCYQRSVGLPCFIPRSVLQRLELMPGMHHSSHCRTPSVLQARDRAAESLGARRRGAKRPWKLPSTLVISTVMRGCADLLVWRV